MTTKTKGKTTTLDVSCPHCKGSGLRMITGRYLETYHIVELNPEKNGARLAYLTCKFTGIDIKATAMNNRLKALERLGVIVGTRDGRQVLWSVVK